MLHTPALVEADRSGRSRGKADHHSINARIRQKPFEIGQSGKVGHSQFGLNSLCLGMMLAYLKYGMDLPSALDNGIYVHSGGLIWQDEYV